MYDSMVNPMLYLASIHIGVNGPMSNHGSFSLPTGGKPRPAYTAYGVPAVAYKPKNTKGRNECCFMPA